jgi:hypothetical protein
LPKKISYNVQTETDQIKLSCAVPQRSWYSHSSGFSGFVTFRRDKAKAGQ